MGRTERQKFYHSKAWKECRETYIQEHSLCERCLANGLIVPAYIVHHRIWIDDVNFHDPSIVLNHSNLESLCFDCHNKEHFKQKQVSSRWKFDEGGNLIMSDVVE